MDNKILLYGRRAGKSIVQKKLQEEWFEQQYMCIFDDAEAPHRKTVCGGV